MSRRARIGLALAIAASAVLLADLAWARYATFHNRTFDLALYARMAWGMARGQWWDPVVGAHVLGLHVSPVMLPLGLMGAALGTVPVLLVVQALAVAATAWPLARFGARRMGDRGALLGASAWLLFPNIGHVATYEFHPGTLAVLPLAWALDGLDTGRVRPFVWGVLGVLACREDLALVTLVLGAMAWRSAPLRVAGRRLALLSLLWLVVFLLVLHPLLAPAHGSLQLHFGRWGSTVPGALAGMATHPGRLLAHLMAGRRPTYLLRLLMPLAALPLLRPRLLLAAAPIFAINLLSDWPTTTQLDSHYQTPALPLLIAAALEAAPVVARSLPRRWVLAGVGATLVAGHLLHGGTPVARDFDAAAFETDARGAALGGLLSRIPAAASVQAPYAAMPHLAERERIGPAPPPERVTDFVLLDLWHRRRYAHREALLRTREEPVARAWLARADHGVVASAGDYVLLARGADPRAAILRRYLRRRRPGAHAGQRIAACLSVLGAHLGRRVVLLDLEAHGPCPADLALRLGTAPRPRRVDLPFDGLLSPAHLRSGDTLRSVHPLSDQERRRIRARGLRVGALRSGGARPEHADPVSVLVPLSPAQASVPPSPPGVTPSPPGVTPSPPGVTPSPPGVTPSPPGVTRTR